jgi:hypothetical protein
MAKCLRGSEQGTDDDDPSNPNQPEEIIQSPTNYHKFK